MSKSKKLTGSRATTKNTGVATRKQYMSDIDPAQIVWSSKTHRTASEAFRDADYATPIWRCESDWDRTKEYLKWIAVWVGFLFFMYQFMVGFEKWIAS